MPRRNSPSKRRIPPDPRFNNLRMQMFVNRMMYRGKKSTAQRLFYEAMDLVEQRQAADPVEIFERAIRNVSPSVEVKPRRVGGSTYQVPVEVDPDRGFSLATRWLLQAARSRNGRSIAEKLANEIMDAANGQGNSIKKREDTHKMAEANRAFAHYRW
ncbi:MAG: 30S ribosomal protein S7 [Anaerolineae bacterium]|nr:30S ribosomal protein S7 [Anaerolineae bacterium]